MLSCKERNYFKEYNLSKIFSWFEELLISFADVYEIDIGYRTFDIFGQEVGLQFVCNDNADYSVNGVCGVSYEINHHTLYNICPWGCFEGSNVDRTSYVVGNNIE